MFSRSFRMISYNKFIRNMEEPVCKECLFFIPNKCLKFGEKNIITGKITFDDAELCRKDYTKCCMTATYFEKKQLQPQPQPQSQSQSQPQPQQNLNIQDLSYYHPLELRELRLLKDF